MTPRKLSITAGLSYLVIFITAIYANFFVLEAMKLAPLQTIQQSGLIVRTGVVAFLLAALFDVVVDWAFNELYKKHPLNSLSTYLRVLHAGIFGVAIFALLASLSATTDAQVLAQLDIFNNIWLTGLFFFGLHLILLSRIINCPKFIRIFLFLAGSMYMIDTCAHFLLENYQDYASTFLTLVAIPSIFGEMALTIWLLAKGGKK